MLIVVASCIKSIAFLGQLLKMCVKHVRNSARRKSTPAKNLPAEAKGESRLLDFKSKFDVNSPADWCELIKDIVAIANSGGGSILVGVDDEGKSCGLGVSAGLLAIDPAVMTDKLAKYTGVQFDSFSIADAIRRRSKIAVITIGAADPPLIFEKPGTYAIEGEKQQKTAFAAGTLYVRHGAKSEPARSADLARLMTRNINNARKEWLDGVKRISMAPVGSTFAVLPPGVIQSSEPGATPIRITDDPKAPGYQLVDPDKTHPWRQKELLRELNNSLPIKINTFDLLAVRRVHRTDDNASFSYRHQFGSQQYSPAFAKWILEKHTGDPEFFQGCRTLNKPIGRVQPMDDEQLLWLTESMRNSGQSTVRTARQLKISEATLSRLLSGKYNGNVERMLQRIEAYRNDQTRADRSDDARSHG